MGMSKLMKSLPFRLALGVAIGIIAGLIANESFMNLVVTLNYIFGQIISFCVPLIVIGFIAPSITKLGKNASRLLGVALILAYTSSLGAALFSMAAGYTLIPHMSIQSAVDGLRSLPEVVFKLDIPPILGVMSALVFSIMIGLAATWTKAVTVTKLLDEFQKIVLEIVQKIVIPILPVYIAFTFCSLAYEGTITKQAPIFISVILIVMAGHYIWMALLYTLAGIYSGRNPRGVIKHYGPAYLTAVGTMSSAATLAVALSCANTAEPLRADMADDSTLLSGVSELDAIPPQSQVLMFANIHLCGSVLTEVFFVMTVSKILYGALPDMMTMVLFCVLLGVFAVGAPGVPGGTVMASLGLITGVLGFDATGTALMLTIFALQDSFGTACNVTGDGALTLMLTGYVEKHGIKHQDLHVDL